MYKTHLLKCIIDNNNKTTCPTSMKTKQTYLQPNVIDFPQEIQ